MLVRETMTLNPITIRPETSVPDALRVMRERKVRRLPVLDAQGRLVGIVSENDLRHAAPSPATTLAVWEISELVAKIKVGQIMTREVVTVSSDTPLEEAARLMIDHRISGLPVMDDNQIVGIITETDVFKAFLDLMGGRRPGTRITVIVAGAQGVLSKLTTGIAEAGGDIVGFGARDLSDSHGPRWELTLKIQETTPERLRAAVQPLVESILDVRET